MPRTDRKRHEGQALDRRSQLLHQRVAATVVDLDRARLERPPVIGRDAEILLEADVTLGRARQRAAGA